MHRGLFHKFIPALLVLLCTLPAAGQFTRDKAGNKKIDEAINTHYFAMDFEKAEGVLLGTVEACGDKCSPQTLARAWMYIGIVRGSGRKDAAGAREAFATALALDEKVKLDADLASPETKQLFAEVGGSGTGGGVAPPASGGEEIGGEEVPGGDIPSEPEEVPGAMVCTPEVRELQTLRPMPLSCSSDEDPASVEVRFKPMGEEKWEKLPLKKTKDGLWQAEIPCSATADPGAVRWYVQARAETGDVIDNYGTEKQPAVMTLLEETAADPPTFPGQEAPARCSGMGVEKEICPPDFPGCGVEEEQCGNKDWGASCENSTECKCGLLCVDSACETAPSCESDSDCPVGSCMGGKCSVSAEASAAGPFKRIWVGIHAAQDIGTIGGEDVCFSGTQADGNFACFEGSSPYPNTSAQDRAHFSNGQLLYAEEPHTGTNIRSGLALGTTRLLLSGDYALSHNLLLGARAGYALLGGNPGDFLPIHAEARATYDLMGLSSAFGVYLGLSVGLAEVDMKVKATMFNCSPLQQGTDITATQFNYGMPGFAAYQDANGQPLPSTEFPGAPAGLAYEHCAKGGISTAYPDNPAIPPVSKTDLPRVPVDVYQKSGSLFAGGHFGGIVRLGEEKNMGVQINVNVMAMLPKQSLVFEPSLGFVYGL